MRNNRSSVPSERYAVAGNGLLDRRLFLSAGAAAAAIGGAPPSKAGELPIEPWMKLPGSPFVGYGQPSKFESKVVRTFASLPGTAGTGASRTPHHLLDGMITPNGVHFERSHSGIPDINPDAHQLLIHGLVKRRWCSRWKAWDAIRGSRASPSSNVAVTANCCTKRSPHRSGFRRFTVSCRARNGPA